MPPHISGDKAIAQMVDKVEKKRITEEERSSARKRFRRDLGPPNTAANTHLAIYKFNVW